MALREENLLIGFLKTIDSQTASLTYLQIANDSVPTPSFDIYGRSAVSAAYADTRAVCL